MTQDIFNEGIDLLVASKRPYKWTGDSKGAYWAALNKFDGDAFYAACKRLNLTAEAMPSIGEISRAIHRPRHVDTAECVLCDKGMIRYIYHRPDGMRYDRWAACTCEPGNRAAIHIVQMVKLSAEAKGERLRADKLDPATYQMPTVRIRYGDSIVPEKWGETKKIADIEAPPEAGVRMRTQVANMKETMVRLIASATGNVSEDINEQIRRAT